MPSTVISAFHYDSKRRVLQIIFISGSVYEYINVPEAVYTAMQGSFSKGIYFNKHIKDHFSFKKIK
jgi:hypothetical protein